MPTVPAPSAPLPLDHLAQVLAMAACGEEAVDHPTLGDVPAPDAPLLVRARLDGDHLELAFLADVGDPAHALRGSHLPAPWQVCGIVAPATARPLDTAPGRTGPAHPVGFALVVARSGAMAHAVRAGGDQPVWLRDGASDAGRGRLVDACRRTLGLPTDAPERGPTALLSALWLDEAVRWVLDRPAGPHPWATIAALHPAVALLGLAPDRAATGGSLDDAAAELASTLRWADVRRAVAERTVTVPSLEPEHADWFDDGAFCRAALEVLPDVPDALSILDAVVAPSLLSRIAAVVLHTARATAPVER